MLFPGAGGYWWRLVHRDTVAAAFKRSAPRPPQRQVPNTPGKESLAATSASLQGRNADRGRRLRIAAGRAALRQAGGPGQIVYDERFPRPGRPRRPDLGQVQKVELSPLIAEYQRKFAAMRAREVKEHAAA